MTGCTSSTQQVLQPAVVTRNGSLGLVKLFLPSKRARCVSLVSLPIQKSHFCLRQHTQAFLTLIHAYHSQNEAEFSKQAPIDTPKNSEPLSTINETQQNTSIARPSSFSAFVKSHGCGLIKKISSHAASKCHHTQPRAKGANSRLSGLGLSHAEATLLKNVCHFDVPVTKTHTVDTPCFAAVDRRSSSMATVTGTVAVRQIETTRGLTQPACF